MRRFGWAVCFLCLSAQMWRGAQASAQGPGDGDAALKNPFDPRPSRPTPSPVPINPGNSEVEKAFFGKSAAPAPSPFLDAGAGAIDPVTGRPKGLAALKPSEKDDINKDIAVTPAQSPWMISVMSYVGPKAPEMAREFVIELRETYKLQAFVFNYGADERRKEYERLKEIIDRQKKFCEENRLPIEQKIRIRYTYVPDQCAVLLGGYSSDEAAQRDLKRIRELPMPDPQKVKMDVKFFALGEQEKRKNGELIEFNLKSVEAQAGGYVNPFKRAFPVRNPTIKAERKEEADPANIAVLRKLNTGEPYNLLACKKPITLAITQFRTPTAVEGTTDSSGGGLLVAMGLSKKKERRDYAADNANMLAETLRNHLKLDAYVLHTRYASIVTVGGYDGADDPNLRSMKSVLQTRLRIPAIELFPEFYPMKVPR